MCGIAGIVHPAAGEGGLASFPPQEIEAMTAAIAHRGPDGEGFHSAPGLALGHRRLSVIDPAGGAQPMCEIEADVWLTYNGEIYNHLELRHELERAGRRSISNGQVLDTLEIARRKHPTGPNSLDALCSRYGIDNSKRVKHGALLDTEILAEVYLELIGGRQPGLALVRAEKGEATLAQASVSTRPPPPHAPTDEELAAHETFVDALDNPIWRL